MTTPNRPLPEGYTLAEGYVFSDDYEHWTVEDLIEMLREFDQDARVWIDQTDYSKDDGGDSVVVPLEMIFGSSGEVYLN